MNTFLQRILSSDPNLTTISAFVAHEALSTGNPEAFFHNLLTNGCISGTVPSLTYYRDTHQFFDYYYHEIENIRDRYESDFDSPIPIHGDLKNAFAWFAFEWIAAELFHEFQPD